ncbi:MAG: hypothetical protein K2X50_02365 [Gammaproteobacteria bacterium]|nr:hypothetical protein [Gammaproteobacteria bacterium]
MIFNKDFNRYNQAVLLRNINDDAQLLPGYLVPKLVKEVPGVLSKVPIDLEMA